MNEDEETVKEPQIPVDPEEEILFAFTVVKLGSGNVMVQAIPDINQASPDDVYNACNQVQRSLDAQNVAGAIQKAMIEAAQASQKAGGLVIPK